MGAVIYYDNLDQDFHQYEKKANENPDAECRMNKAEFLSIRRNRRREHDAVRRDKNPLLWMLSSVTAGIVGLVIWGISDFRHWVDGKTGFKPGSSISGTSIPGKSINGISMTASKPQVTSSRLVKRTSNKLAIKIAMRGPEARAHEQESAARNKKPGFKSNYKSTNRHSNRNRVASFFDNAHKPNGINVGHRSSAHKPPALLLLNGTREQKTAVKEPVLWQQKDRNQKGRNQKGRNQKGRNRKDGNMDLMQTRISAIEKALGTINDVNQQPLSVMKKRLIRQERKIKALERELVDIGNKVKKAGKIRKEPGRNDTGRKGTEKTGPVMTGKVSGSSTSDIPNNKTVRARKVGGSSKVTGVVQKKARPVVIRQVNQRLPFKVIAVNYAGKTLSLGVMKKGQVEHMQRGQSYSGWKLVGLKDNHAIFRRGSRIVKSRID